jgi:hypothetical protein
MVRPTWLASRHFSAVNEFGSFQTRHYVNLGGVSEDFGNHPEFGQATKKKMETLRDGCAVLVKVTLIICKLLFCVRVTAL